MQNTSPTDFDSSQNTSPTDFDSSQNKELLVKKARYEELRSESGLLQIELGILSSRVKSAPGPFRRLPPQEYRDICAKQLVIKMRLASIEAEMLPLKHRLRASRNVPNQHLHDEVLLMRNKWVQFAEDRTRVNSLRALAATFARELTEAITRVEST